LSFPMPSNQPKSFPMRDFDMLTRFTGISGTLYCLSTSRRVFLCHLTRTPAALHVAYADAC
jgi:hypothetical protein